MTTILGIQGDISSDDGTPFDSEVFETEFYEWLENRNMRFTGFTEELGDE